MNATKVFAESTNHEESMHVTAQPTNAGILNTFKMLPGEKFVKQWDVARCCNSNCFGRHAITLTDSRLLSRSEACSWLGCLCGCCCDHPHIDSTINLQNIAQIRTFSGTACYLWIFRIWNCDICCVPNALDVRGSFGSELIYVDRKEEFDVQATIPLTIAKNESKRND
ncbi:unnamed protein product [Rotaria socialis]|uniref:Uncharacterized protein n=1 Tax=Rotaria socialis TaxID=392032 RepID=A0A821NM41_9BILA|nr:unnamed protein product [Rotaria socialis]CAF3376021.1 unnamed protein product [Rotaria socialis]CAF3418159.1 unnamed protein product [Rotaria socialis]CAF4272882.1 unnamed protein product [Rotaria socialis]CAF4293652.1 unnamed protein product [Rotaria socialis]